MQSDQKMLRIFITGTTAVGKTKLSVALAQHIQAQIISCDSKQLYRHASIMTAKVTEEQAHNIPHHMVDCLQLDEHTYNRNKYFTAASYAIHQIQGKHRNTIVVGGTNYYLQTLLFNIHNLTNTPSDLATDSKPSHQSGQGSGHPQVEEKALSKELEQEIKHIQGLSREEKYRLLLQKDKAIALKTHQNDQNRINLFLQRILRSGHSISDKYHQRTNELRHSNTIVFWVRNSDKDEHFSMITKRIHKMLDKEGLSQIFAIYYYVQMCSLQVNKKTEIDTIQEDSGACSSIGIRQFKSLYLQVKQQLDHIFTKHQGTIKDNNKPQYPLIHSLIHQHFQTITFQQTTLAQCREQLVLDTKRYCKRQLTWIRNRMYSLQPSKRQHFFVLELSQNQNEQKMEVMQRFQKQVERRAKGIVDMIREEGFGSILEGQNLFSQADKQQPLQQWKKHYCQACSVQLNGLYNWNCHVESKRHMVQQKHFDKKQERQLYIQQQRKLADERKRAKAEQEQIVKKEGCYQL